MILHKHYNLHSAVSSFSYFTINGKQYQVIGQVDRANRDEPLDLQSIYVRNNMDELIQLDNLVTIDEQSNPPQLYHHNRFMSATVSAGLAPEKPSEMEYKLWKKLPIRF